MTHVDATIPLYDFSMRLEYWTLNEKMNIRATSSTNAKIVRMTLLKPIEFHETSSLPSSRGEVPVFRTELAGNSQILLEISGEGVSLHDSLDRLVSLPKFEYMSGTKPGKYSRLQLAKPNVRPDLKALKAPLHRFLTNSEIKQKTPSAKNLYDVNDLEGDDKGIGSYLYPQTPNIKPGSLDITQFNVSVDDHNVYFKLTFKNLSSPGWHPEYGFQLTFVAIAIEKGRQIGSGQTNVGMNSNYTLDHYDAFEDIIYVGGGIKVANDSGRILAEYLPGDGDEKNPLGNASMKTIEFSIPIAILGRADSLWRYTVLIGCQDDHGGAGIGEFRSVEAEAKEWAGGGKMNPNDPNVYDVILPPKQ